MNNLEGAIKSVEVKRLGEEKYIQILPEVVGTAHELFERISQVILENPKAKTHNLEAIQDLKSEQVGAVVSKAECVKVTMENADHSFEKVA